MANSLICPIIAPFGLLWMLLRYFVNKYNLYFVYRPDPIDIRVHMEAIDMLIAAPITCLLWLYLTFLLTAGFWSAIALSTMLLALITFLACNAHKLFGCFKYIRPKKFKVSEEAAEKDTEVYLPRVLTMMRETIRTGPVAESMSTDSVVVMRQETCEAADNGPVAESCTGSVFRTAEEKKDLQGVVKTAQVIFGSPLPDLGDIHLGRLHRRVVNISRDPSHPGHHLFATLH
ncbi:unnamed protein product [Pleuronectes platessa]|uniref:CSC1/OSCA1-like 7TM region domain-containing protein n=1 Tax=Pleuronectes platessa TaxID=8262 RepID=A0A9N7W410_PLEPL|nr:unnamed protein product [Pleuronectes platessa]